MESQAVSTHKKISSPLHALVAGLTRPGALALGVMLSTCLALGILCLTLITPRLLASPLAGYFSSGAWDDYTDVTAAALRLAQDPADRPALILLGASSTRESFTLTRTLPEQIATQCGVTPQLYHLATSDQTSWEMAALAAQLPRGRPAVIVLGLAALRFAVPATRLNELATHPRFGFHSDIMDEEARLTGIEPPVHSGLYFLDQRSFLLPRIKTLTHNLLTLHPRHRRENLYQAGRPAREGKWARYVQQYPAQEQDYTANLPVHTAVIERLVQRFRDRPEVHIALFAPPVNPRIVADARRAELFRAHATRMQHFAAQHRLSYWTFDREAGLTAEDFHDANHLKNAARQRRYTEILARRVAALLGEGRAEGPL
jgi:hypothetical protein